MAEHLYISMWTEIQIEISKSIFLDFFAFSPFDWLWLYVVETGGMEQSRQFNSCKTTVLTHVLCGIETVKHVSWVSHMPIRDELGGFCHCFVI